MLLDMRPLENIMEDHRPWKRKFDDNGFYILSHRVDVHYRVKTHDNDYEAYNIDLDVDMKNAVFRASAAVVSLSSYSGKKKVFSCSGTIIECDEVNGMHHGIVLSSATLVRCPTRKNHIADNIKVDVRLSDGRLYDGEIMACDMQYNLILIKIQSDSQLATASLRRLDDSVKIGLSQVLPPGDKSFQLHHHSNLFKILPGEIVIAVGRYHENPYKLLAYGGVFSNECCTFDCKELLRVNCQISEYGIGGPIVNRYGEVIGVSYYAGCHTPFLPINVALRWFEHFKKNGGFCRLQLGMQLANLYTAGLEILEKVIQKFPGTSEGVIVEKMMSYTIGDSPSLLNHWDVPLGTLVLFFLITCGLVQTINQVTVGSAADLAGIHPQDVIVHCSGKIVQSFLQLLDIIWDKAGEAVELVVLRPCEGASLNLTLVFNETAPGEFNRWPLKQNFWDHARRLDPKH